jgi:hypothetical protein
MWAQRGAKRQPSNQWSTRGTLPSTPAWRVEPSRIRGMQASKASV